MNKSKLIELDSADSNASISLDLINHARFSIDIFTHDMDPRVLNNSQLLSAIISFIKISPKSKLRILILDPSTVVQKGHLFLELSRKFSSFIEIRQVNPEYHAASFSFLMVDHKSMLYRPINSIMQATLHMDESLVCREHLEYFNEVWQHSQPVNEFKQLFI